MSAARVVRISGALAHARPLPDAGQYELARIGTSGLLAEIIRFDGDIATLQVYEDTTGLELGTPVHATGEPLTVELGPGLLGSILDGVGRPLHNVAELTGDFVTAGADTPTLSPTRRWEFTPSLRAGAQVSGGDVLGEIGRAHGLAHRVLVPPGVSGRLAALRGGLVTIRDAIGELDDGTPLRLGHRWPIRRPRPVGRRLPGGRPLLTGQRIFDLLFPIAEGGTVAVPGGFGTGKTVIEHSLAKFAAADVVVFVGCGERGNEMAEVLQDFPDLVDSRTGRAVMERTVLIVNTSNMPVVAREASIYLAITIAEYFRDMGYRAAVMIDSLSRWAEALRDIAARLQEMPGEEGYPTYMASRLGQIFERAGRATPLGSPEREGAVSMVCAVSPPGGDFSEPVTQASLRVAGGLWALDAGLAHQRQFPAVDWAASYSLYVDDTRAWFAEHADPRWPKLRERVLVLLQQDAELREIAGLLGAESLQDSDRLILEVARMIREYVLGQSAFDPADAFSPLTKTARLTTLAVDLYHAGAAALERGASFEDLDLNTARRALASVRRAHSDALAGPAERVEAAIARVERLGSGEP